MTTHCRFADFFHALGEPELGTLLICAADFDIAAVGEREVTLERDQTLMRGAARCTFRYRFAPREVATDGAKESSPDGPDGLLGFATPRE